MTQAVPRILTPKSRTARFLHNEDGITGNSKVMEAKELMWAKRDAERLKKLRSALKYVRDVTSSPRIHAVRGDLYELISLSILNQKSPDWLRTQKILKLKKWDELHDLFNQLVD